MRIYIPQVNENSRNLKRWNTFLTTISPAFKEKKIIYFDFSKCHFISAEGIAVLSGIKFMREKNNYKTEIDCQTIDARVKVVLERWGFLRLFDPDMLENESNLAVGTTIPIFQQEKLDKNEVINYIDQNILNRTEMPRMSDALRKEIRRAFFEVFGNIFAHSNSAIGGLVCGQIFPKDRTIQIVFYDIGIGIAKNVRNSDPLITSDENAIGWALQRGTSTLSSESVSRGLGLYLIRLFLQINEGDFRIYANLGSVKEASGTQLSQKLEHPIQGTLIDLRINIRNDITYILASESEV
jgi:hypothetical protein